MGKMRNAWRSRFVCAFIVISASVTGASLRAPHVVVKYDGITEAQARSIAEVVSYAWIVLTAESGFDLWEEIPVFVSIRKESAQAKLWTNGTAILMELAKPDDFALPERSGYYHLYGLCHELGHIVADRNLNRTRFALSFEGSEGWAHYLGSVVVDRLFEEFGPPLWYEPYDYREDGTIRLHRQLASVQPDGTVTAAGKWMELERLIGRRGFAPLFRAWGKERCTILTSDDEVAFEGILLTTFPAQAEALKAWWQSAAPLLFQRH